ncbi:MAG: hypothetical protein ACYC6Y_10520 [Thermoguttaceae bacterium]
MQVGARTVGIIVDGVDEVLRISKTDIAPPPLTVSGLGNEYLEFVTWPKCRPWRFW